MSPTSRDSPSLKDTAPNVSATPATGRSVPDKRCCNTPADDRTQTGDPLGILAAVSRIVLVRSKALSVSGAYAWNPDAHRESGPDGS